MIKLHTTLDMNSKTRALAQLQEESKIIYQAARFLVILYLGSALFHLLILAGGILFQDSIIPILNDGHGLKGQSLLISFVFKYIVEGYAPNAAGRLNLPVFLFHMADRITSSCVAAYIFYCILKVFHSIQNGVTPFTLRIAGYWKRCYYVFAAITTILFLLSFVTQGTFIILIPFPLIFACFFYAISLIFEYGTCLQAESDETL